MSTTAATGDDVRPAAEAIDTTAMGGSENVPAAVHRLTQTGLRNVLVQAGVLAGEFVPRPRPTK